MEEQKIDSDKLTTLIANDVEQLALKLNPMTRNHAPIRTEIWNSGGFPFGLHEPSPLLSEHEKTL